MSGGADSSAFPGRRPRGRPKAGSDSEKRALRKVRFNALEWDTVVRKANAANLRPLTYVRVAALGSRIVDVRAVQELDQNLRAVQSALDLLDQLHPCDTAEEGRRAFTSLARRLVHAQYSRTAGDLDDPHSGRSEIDEIAADVDAFTAATIG